MASVVGKTIFSDGKGKLFFGYYKDNDAVEFVDYKTWKKLSFKDVSKGKTNKERVIKAILKNQKQFNKKVDFNMWAKKNNPSFEQTMDWFIKNGWISNVTKRGIKESVNEEKVYIDFLNKKKGFKQDRIKFNSYEDAVKWAKKNFEKFNPDMIKYESVNEGISVFDERHFGKKGIIIMIDDNGKKVSAIFKDKKNADKYNRNNPSDIKKLLDLAKKTKYPKAIDESVNEGKDDFMARHGRANINLKKGYKHHTADELEDLYNKLGKLVKGLKVKDVNLVFESVNEGVEPQIKKIAYFTGTRPEAVEDFVSKHSLNITKLLKYVEKGGLPQRMDVVSALAGRPNNPKQKKIIKQFQESVNEAKFGYKDSTASYINKHKDEYKQAEKMNKGNEKKFYDLLQQMEEKIGHSKTMLFISNALRGYKVDMFKDPKIKNPADAQEALFLLSK